MIGLQLPFTGRDNELKILQDCIQTNIGVWKMWCSLSKDPHMQHQVLEGGKRAYCHPAVAGGPGRGKTTLMQRGIMKIMRKNFVNEWTGRAFGWDLEQSEASTDEKMLARQSNIEGIQRIFAMRILHKSINGSTLYSDFLVDLKEHLHNKYLAFDDLTLEGVLDHIVGKRRI